MCIAAFVWQNHPVYPFILLLNRDQFFSRSTKPLGWWEGGEILGGRDGVVGGTWMACSRSGKVAFVMNVREQQKLAKAKSRGHLLVRFLEGTKSPMEFAEEVVAEADQYNGFNLILADLCSNTMLHVTNRPKEDNKQLVTEVSPGVHVLTNAKLDCSSRKAERLGDNFKSLLNEQGYDLPLKEMVEKLMTDTLKFEEESQLPYPPEVIYHISSIFVENSPQLGHYGTRSTSALSVKTSGEVCYYERYLENEVWKEGTVTYQINCADEMKEDCGKDMAQ